MKLCAEVSLYPLKTNDASSIINNSIQALDGKGIEYKVGSISTHIHGKPEIVWEGLRSLFEEAEASGEVNMVVSLSNAAD